jgi:hypothetical protein
MLCEGAGTGSCAEGEWGSGARGSHSVRPWWTRQWVVIEGVFPGLTNAALNVTAWGRRPVCATWGANGVHKEARLCRRGIVWQADALPFCGGWPVQVLQRDRH